MHADILQKGSTILEYYSGGCAPHFLYEKWGRNAVCEDGSGKVLLEFSPHWVAYLAG